MSRPAIHRLALRMIRHGRRRVASTAVGMARQAVPIGRRRSRSQQARAGGPMTGGSVRADDIAQPALPGTGPRVEIRRSRRRRRTVQAYQEGDTVVVLMPAGLSRAAEQRHVADLLGRLTRRERRRHPSEPDLAKRAEALRARYLPEAPEPVSVRYVSNQLHRWGSCTPDDGSIRLTDRMIGMPGWVLDYVLLHELCHLVVAAHDGRFQALLDRFPHVERAKGFLAGYEHAHAHALGGSGGAVAGHAHLPGDVD
jgi:predicted metal-dependent hydrolase